MSIGPPEIVFLFVLALLLFGPKRLPEVGRAVGQAMRELKRMSSEVTTAFEEAMEERPRSTGHEWDQPASTADDQQSPACDTDLESRDAEDLAVDDEEDWERVYADKASGQEVDSDLPEAACAASGNDGITGENGESEESPPERGV